MALFFSILDVDLEPVYFQDYSGEEVALESLLNNIANQVEFLGSAAATSEKGKLRGRGTLLTLDLCRVQLTA